MTCVCLCIGQEFWTNFLAALVDKARNQLSSGAGQAALASRLHAPVVRSPAH